MTPKSPKSASVWKLPALCIIAIIMLLCMLRLGVWQLDRAEQKRDIVAQLTSRGHEPTVVLKSPEIDEPAEGLRFRKTELSGSYVAGSDFLHDNQVVNGQVGYQVFTPFRVDGSDIVVMVARGWVPVGESRDVLPEIDRSNGQIVLTGRLNSPPAKPPLWNDKYPTFSGVVWQYLPLNEVAAVLNSKVYPLVLELAPDADNPNGLVRKWPEINDQWVAKHQGYAFQWFAMATAFLIACLVLFLRRNRRKETKET